MPVSIAPGEMVPAVRPLTSTQPAKASTSADSFRKVTGSLKNSADISITKQGGVYRRMEAVARVVCSMVRK